MTNRKDILEQIVKENGDTYDNIEQVKLRLLATQCRLYKLNGFLKGLQYNKDDKIDCNWEFDLYLLINLIDKFAIHNKEVQK
jgi:hypothetical protein